MPTLPLAGIRVVDMTVVWAGPGTTTLLGDLGAEVIRVEDIHHFPNSTRGLAPRMTREQAAGAGFIGSMFPDRDPGEHPFNRHAMFNSHGRNKKSVTMNLADPRGRRAFLDLIARSDVFVENNSLRVIRSLDIDYDVLSRVNPRLVMLRMPPLGLDGPFSEFLGYGPNFNALTGIVAMSGHRGTDPTTAGDNYHMDEVAGPAAAFAVMLGLRRREKTGTGTLIEFAQAENVAQDVGELVLDTQLNPGRERQLLGNGDPVYLQSVFPAAGEDRWIAITIRTDDEWVALREAMGDPAWAHDPAYATPAGRRENEDALVAAVSDWTARHDNYELFHELQRRGIAAGPVSTETMVNTDPQWAARRYFRELTHLECGTHLHPGHPWKPSGMELRWERGAPVLGQDNEYVYKELLGFTDADYAALEAEGQIGTDYV